MQLIMKFPTILLHFVTFAIIDGAISPEEMAEMDRLCKNVTVGSYEIFPSSSDCSVFFNCNGGKAWLQKCPLNLYFNSNEKVYFVYF